MACWMEREEPPPISIIAITAAMPMMIPRQVSAERITLRRSARNAMRAVRTAFLNWLKSPCKGAQGGGGRLGVSVWFTSCDCAGGPSSTITPSFMRIIRCA